MHTRRSFLPFGSPVALLLAVMSCSSESPDPGSDGSGRDVMEEGNGLQPDPSAMPDGEGRIPGDTMVPGGTIDEEMRPEDIPITAPAEEEPPAMPGGGGLTSPGPELVPAALDCGPDGWAVENHGPASNRVNYIILADGYTAQTIETTLVEHIERAMDRRFNHESGEPYGRYRKFVNICVMRAVSQNNGIGNGPTAFGGGNGGDRLARVNQQLVNAYLDQNLPEGLVADWRAVVLNQGLWENTGSATMLWSGANRDAAGAALHEGGHGFHQLADEYCARGAGPICGPEATTGPTSDEEREVNSTGNPETTGGKWDLWLGSIQKGLKVPDLGATGIQSVFAGSRYVNTGQYRPSNNSMMNSLFGDELDTSFNSVSREQMIFSIWRAVRPVDSTDPPEGNVASPATLTVNVVDPAVISIDWSVDGTVVAERAGSTLNIAAAGLASGTHTISAKAYDNATEDLVRYRTNTCPGAVSGNYCHATAWQNSIQTVEWVVTIP